MATTSQMFEAYKSELKECIDNLSVTTGSVKKMVEDRISVLQDLISDYLLRHSNYDDFFNGILSDVVSRVYTKRVNIYSEIKGLIYSPTQVGKTDAMIRVVKDFISRGVSIVISSDNKKDQMDQLVKRLTTVKNDTVFEKTLIVMVGSTSFDNFSDEYIENEYETFVICCLDNASQISKVYDTVNYVYEEQGIERLLVIHDEGDIVNKSRNVESIESGVAKSHKEWIKFFTKLSDKSISMKRIFVTATPENVIVLHKPKYMWALQIPDNYVGSNSIEYHSITDFDNAKIVKILKKESRLRKEELGVILYVVERNKDENDDDTANQTSVFNYLTTVYNKHGMDVLSIYNSDGITASFKLQKFKKRFVETLVNEKIKYEQYDNIIKIKKSKLNISDFYRIVQDVGCKMVLTIGKDLISRGISFVSSSKENPLTATTMIYKPGQTLHQVGLCQAIGRLTGTAQPSLKRRLYSTDEVSTEYLTFIKNQKMIIDTIKENGNRVDLDIIEEMVLEKSKRTIDRKKLNINKDFKYREENDSGSDGEYELDAIDGVKLDSLRKWVNDDTLVGRMVRYLYDQDKEITLEEFKEGVNYEGTEDQLNSNIYNGGSIKSRLGKIWSATNNKIILNEKIRKYIDELK